MDQCIYFFGSVLKVYCIIWVHIQSISTYHSNKWSYEGYARTVYLSSNTWTIVSPWNWKSAI